MFTRLSKADWVAASAAALGLIVVFLPWYSYSQGASHITVNGFRASLLGDVFFLSAAAMGLLLLMRHGLISDLLTRRVSQRAAYAIVAGIAAASVLDQLLLVSGGHRAVAAGLILAMVVAVGMVTAAWLRGGDRSPSRAIH
jgi:hypothetical protein